MNLKRYMFIVLILLVCMISVSAVSAADDGASDIISADDNEEIVLDEAIDDDVSSANDNYNDKIILEDDYADDKPTLSEGSSTGSFTDLNETINGNQNTTISLNSNYTFNGTDDDDSAFLHGIYINRSVTIDGNGCTIDGDRKARIFNIGEGGNVKFLNVNFINGNIGWSDWNSDGGAIYAEYSNCEVESCNFINNTALYGGALQRVNAYDCTFTENQAEIAGGAINQADAYNCTFSKNQAGWSGGALNQGTAYSCNFTGNYADNGGALQGGIAYSCNFKENQAKKGGALCWSSAYQCNFTENRAETAGGGIYGGSDSDYKAALCIFESNTPDDYIYLTIVDAALNADDLTTNYKSGEKLLFNLTCDNQNYDGFNTTIKIYENDVLVGTYYALSGEGWVVDLDLGTYNAVLSLDKYAGVTDKNVTIIVNKLDAEIIPSIDTIDLYVGDSSIVENTLIPSDAGEIVFTSNDTGVVTIDSDGGINAVGAGTATITISLTSAYYSASNATVNVVVSKKAAEITPSNPTMNLFVGDESKVEYTLSPTDAAGDITFTSSNPNVVTVDSTGRVKATGEGTATITISLTSTNYDAPDATVNVAVSKKATKLTASAVTTTYNVAKDLVITLKDVDGNPISDAKVTVDLNGAKKYTTDKKGQVKVAIGKLVPKTYTAKISFAGDNKYIGSDTTAKVTVKKATPKLTAKAKAFKFEDKTKKYTVTLKDNKGNVLKNKKVTLKVNGKTYTATTNSKGVATFKLTKMTKKGKFTAVVTYAGDKYYNKATKKAKITVKAPAWKTVSKGSKDKATVKKIQKALKDNGYYLTYKGHYLKIDGIYDSCTVRSVKQFQKAKKLQVTGKVDYATAKKLKLVS